MTTHQRYRGNGDATKTDWSACAACVFSYMFLLLVVIVDNEDDIKEVEERLGSLLV